MCVHCGRLRVWVLDRDLDGALSVRVIVDRLYAAGDVIMQVQPRMNGAGHGRCLQQLAAMALRTVPGEDDHLTRTAADSLACDLGCDFCAISAYLAPGTL